MKQLLVVVLVTAVVVAGWMVYRGGDDAPRPTRTRTNLTGPAARPADRGRPRVSGERRTVQTPEGEVEVEVNVPDRIGDRSDEMRERREVSWREFVKATDVVPLEEAWDFDWSEADFDADVVLAVETPAGSRVEITRGDWERYVALTEGLSLVRARLFAERGRAIAEEFGDTYGFTDEQWEEFLEVYATNQGVTRDEYASSLVHVYGLDVEGSLRTRRLGIEGLMGHLPSVEQSVQLPPVVRRVMESSTDENMMMQLAGGIRSAREDLSDEARLDGLAKTVDLLNAIFTRIQPEVEFRRTWSWLDGSTPDDVVASCALGSLETSELTPPWLQPGEVARVEVDDVLPHVPPLDEADRVDLLRELVWLKVLRRQLADEGKLGTPEETWFAFADDYMRREGSPINLTGHASMVGRYPSNYHYRSFKGVLWHFQAGLPESWESEEDLREFYADNQVFVESWTPAMEAILFPAMRIEDGVQIDWERSRREAEEARERILAGEVEFSELRREQHEAYREQLVAAGLEDMAEQFEETFRGGVLGGRMPKIQRTLGESPFETLVDCASLVKNAIARLDRGEISPVWRGPLGHVVVRVMGVAAAELEGVYEDYRGETKAEFVDARFRQWANGVLGGSELAY